MCTVSSDGIDTSNDVTGEGPTLGPPKIGNWDPISDLSNGINQGLSTTGNSINSGLQQATNGITSETIMDAILQIYTGGLIGLEDGGLKKGYLIRGGDEFVGELSGRNVARDAADATNTAIAEAKKATERERQFAAQKQEADERRLSNKAASKTRLSNTGTGGSGGGSSNDFQTDFLGL